MDLIMDAAFHPKQKASSHVVLLGGQPCSQYRIAWHFLSQHFQGCKIFKAYLKEKEEYSSVALKERPDAIDWEKLESEFQEFKSDSGEYASQSESTDSFHDMTRLLVCSDRRIISAPAKIFECADLVIISFANEKDTFQNLILQKEDSGIYRDILWPGSIQRFLSFEQTFKSLNQVTKQKIVFIDDSASINYFYEISDTLAASIKGDNVSKFALGVRGDIRQAMACCTQPIPNLTPQEASNRLINIRSDMKNMFRENAKNAIESLLQSYPESRHACVAFVLDKVTRKSVQATLMTTEEYKSICQEIITRKFEIFTADSTGKLSVANVFSKHALEFWLRTKEDLYSLNTPNSLRCFVDSWKSCQDAGVEPQDMEFLDPELRESIQNISAIRRLCTKLYVVHNFFCIDNPSIFHVVIGLLRSRNPLFINLGFSLLSDILSLRSAERFSKYFRDEEQHLGANVAISALEGLGHIFQPIRNFMQLEDGLKTAEIILETSRYLSKLSDLLSADVWEALELLFWGLAQHATVISPSHVKDILEPLFYAQQYLVATPRDIHKLSVSMIAIMHHILRCGPTGTVEVIMSYSREIAVIACVQIKDEIEKHSGESNMEVSHITNIVHKVLLAILNLLERIGVPSLERTFGEVEDDFSMKAQGDFQTCKRPSPAHSITQHEYERITELYRSDYALRQQLEVEQKSSEVRHQKALQDSSDTILKLQQDIRSKSEQISEFASRESDLNARIVMLEKKNQELMAAATNDRWPATDHKIESGNRLSSNEHACIDRTGELKQLHIQTDTVSSLDLANMIDKGAVEANVDQLKRLVALIYEERANMPSALRPSFCGMLKHLGADLYTSQAHFMQEMLQNADDANFKVGSSPAMHVFLADKSITVGHNEEGMSAHDVLALCSAASSNKIAGTHTGQKGLGFKSVYACSKSPVIISKDWRFQFNADPDKCADEMAYISPTWLDSNPTDLNFVMEALGPNCELWYICP